MRAGLVLLAVLVALCLAAPLVAPRHYADQDLSAQYLPPGEGGHPLGTDLQGRDLLSRVLFGGRISLLVGFAATLVSVLIGVAYGLVSGYAGGRTDRLLMRVVDVLYSLPFLFLVVLVLALFVGPAASPAARVGVLLLVLGAVQWLTMARIVRGQVLTLREREFVLAAKATGAGHLRILAGHILPNLTGVIAVYATLTVPRVILQESFLSFLGLGIPEPYPSWGRLAAEGVRAVTPVGTHWWLILFPSLAISLTLYALHRIGDAIAGGRGGPAGPPRDRRRPGRPRTAP